MTMSSSVLVLFAGLNMYVQTSFGLVPGATLTFDFFVNPSMKTVGAYSTSDAKIVDCPHGGATQAGLSRHGFSFILGVGLTIPDAISILGRRDYSFVWDVTFVDTLSSSKAKFKLLTVGGSSSYGLYLADEEIQIKTGNEGIEYNDDTDYQLIFTWSQSLKTAKVYLHTISSGDVQTNTWNVDSSVYDALTLSDPDMVFFNRHQDRCNEDGPKQESHVRSIQVWDRTLTSQDVKKIIDLRGEVLEFACQYVNDDIIISLDKYKADVGTTQSMSDCINLVGKKCAGGTTAVRDDDNGRCYCWASNLDALKDDVTSNVRACLFRTMSPTRSPSRSPTSTPTKAPTQHPSKSPATPVPSWSPITPAPTTSSPTTPSPTTPSPTTTSPTTHSPITTSQSTRDPTTTQPTPAPTSMPNTLSTLSKQLTSPGLGSITGTQTPPTNTITPSSTPFFANTGQSSSSRASSTIAAVVIVVFVSIIVGVVLFVLFVRRRNADPTKQKESNSNRKPTTTTIPAFIINPGSKSSKPQFDNKAFNPSYGEEPEEDNEYGQLDGYLSVKPATKQQQQRRQQKPSSDSTYAKLSKTNRSSVTTPNEEVGFGFQDHNNEDGGGGGDGGGYYEVPDNHMSINDDAPFYDTYDASPRQ